METILIPLADPVITEEKVTEAPPPESSSLPDKTRGIQITLLSFSAVAFLYFARPVLLPLFLACIAGMTLKPLIDWGSRYRIPKTLSAAIVLSVLVAAIVIGFVQLGRPGLRWINETPEHISELRQKVQNVLPRMGNLKEAAAAVNDLGSAVDEKKEKDKSPTVAVKVSNQNNSFLNWTGSFLVGLGETLVLLYLLLASGDLFTQKIVHLMPTWRDKKRAVEINREIQHNISHYLFSVTLINLGLGLVAGIGFFFLQVPNPAMWGMVVTILNYVPYFGPIAGVALLGIVGLLTFESLPQALTPPSLYLLLHLLEANFITPILLGRRFTLNPVVIFVSLLFWTWLWGVPGALLSVPLLVSIKVICDRVSSLTPVSELLAS